MAIIGAGRIGAGFMWSDLAYTHAGAAQALRDRVELVGFIEPDNDRAVSAKLRWEVPVYEDVPTGLMALRPDIVSVCVQPEQQPGVMKLIEGVKGIWCEKPFVSQKPDGIPVMVNYMRRGDQKHQDIASFRSDGKLVVYGKDDIHTRCHFEDLAKWWKCSLDYRVFHGPCAYLYEAPEYCRAYEDNGLEFFDNGGVDGGQCFREMLRNLLDHIDTGVPLWSPAE